MSFNYKDVSRIIKILQIKWQIIEIEGKFPDFLQKFFRIGITLFNRMQYDMGYHSNDITESEIIYAKYTDEQLLLNFNQLYKLITLKYGHLL